MFFIFFNFFFYSSYLLIIYQYLFSIQFHFSFQTLLLLLKNFFTFFTSFNINCTSTLSLHISFFLTIIFLFRSFFLLFSFHFYFFRRLFCSLYISTPYKMPPITSTLPGRNGLKPDSQKIYLRRPHKKSHLGCKNCKQRRIKCDEHLPLCSQCKRANADCSYLSYTPQQISEHKEKQR